MIMTEIKKEKYWSKFAKTFNDDQRYIAGSAIQQALKKRLSEESDLGELIEFGCGAGFFTTDIATKASHVVATDLSDEMVEAATTQLREFENVTVQKEDCENTSLPSAGFDTVFMANLIHVIEDPHNALQESHRILRDGGSLLVTSGTFHGLKWFTRIGASIRFVRKFGIPPRYTRSYSPDELRSLVETAGFSVERVEFIQEKTNFLYLKGTKQSTR